MLGPHLLLEENEGEEILLQQINEGNAEVYPIFRTRREEGFLQH